MNENKTLVFDMDGTIADLYGVTDWLEKLMDEDESPYIEAKAFYTDEVLNTLLNVLKSYGWRIVVTSWLCKGGSSYYDTMVRDAKLKWLDRHDFPYDEVHIVKYGTTKANCTRHLGGFQILVDDNEKVRSGWHLGDTIDANKDVLVELTKLVTQELEKTDF